MESKRSKIKHRPAYKGHDHDSANITLWNNGKFILAEVTNTISDLELEGRRMSASPLSSCLEVSRGFAAEQFAHREVWRSTVWPWVPQTEHEASH